MLSAPARPLPEGRLKNAVRSGVLSLQHSLPTELAVNRGDVVVQVGTPNVQTMVRFARAVGASGRLVIVEAMPENQETLQAAIDSNGLGQVTLVRAAACDENGQGELAVSQSFRGDHRLPLEAIAIDNDQRTGNEAMCRIPVRLIRLDDELPGLGVDRLDYLSVTVNGAEAEVIRGCRRLLAASSVGVRVYAKGHALDAHGAPLHESLAALLREEGLRVKITRGEPGSVQRRRAGDVYAWKTGRAVAAL